MPFFVWYDDTPKKLAGDKLREAIAAYTERFNIRPTLVLANTATSLRRSTSRCATSARCSPTASG